MAAYLNEADNLMCDVIQEETAAAGNEAKTRADKLHIDGGYALSAEPV